MKRITISFFAIYLFSVTVFAQSPVVKADSLAKKPVAYKKIIPENAKAQHGLFDIKQVDQKWYFEVPDSLLGRYLLTVTRYVATPQGMEKFGGEEINRQTIYFEKGNNNNLLLRGVVYAQDIIGTDTPLAKAVQQSGENPIISAFDIKATNPETGNYVIDVTDLFKKDVAAISFSAMQKTNAKLGTVADDRSFIEKMNTFPINVEVKTTKTYSMAIAAVPAGAQTGFVTLRLNTSIVLLPKVPMMQRIMDERVGYFASKYVLFDENRQRADAKFFIQRYRLEPKDKDLEKYKKGILVEPKKQIVYYIDPATPKKWRPYLIKGINDWQKAFESAGFKNAIIGKEWPEQDTTMSLEDARFSVVRYLASETPNAYGPRISDPRSGEIIESHVGWYHNVMKLVHNWYMIQAGPLDPRARKMQFDDELMGELIRFVSSHEIGHTLGLRHNMGASSQTPVAKLRDKNWVEKNGHTVSIMDYARFNYVAQPEDNISPKGIYPRIGAYDKWAINFGYRYYQGMKNPYVEEKMLGKMVSDTLTKHPQLWFGGEGDSGDPRSQKEDIGDDAVLASDYGIKNLKRVVPNLIAWTHEDGDHYDNLLELHKELVKQYKRYLFHVEQNIGSKYVTQKSSDQLGPVIQEVPKAKVKSAVDYVARQLFDTPLWLYPDEITDLIKTNALEDISEMQAHSLTILLSPGLLFNLADKAFHSKDPYTASEHLASILPRIWKKMDGSEEQQAYVRSLHRAYLEKMNLVINPKDVSDGKAMSTIQRSDVRLEGMKHVADIRKIVLQLIPQSTGINKMHFEDILVQIDKILKKTTINP